MKFMKIRPVGAELLHAVGRTDRQTDSHDEDNSRNFAKAPKNSILSIWKEEAIWEIESRVRK
jgi:hypothetical protein